MLKFLISFFEPTVFEYVQHTQEKMVDIAPASGSIPETGLLFGNFNWQPELVKLYVRTNSGTQIYKQLVDELRYDLDRTERKIVWPMSYPGKLLWHIRKRKSFSYKLLTNKGWVRINVRFKGM